MASPTTLIIGLMAPVIALGILLTYLSSIGSSSTALLPEYMLKVPEEYQNQEEVEEVEEIVLSGMEFPNFQFVFPNYTHSIEIDRGENITIPVSIYSVDNRTLNVKIYVYSEETTSRAQVEDESIIGSILPIKKFPDGINAYADVKEVTIPAYSGTIPQDFSTWEKEANKVTFNLTIEVSRDAEPRIYPISIDGSVEWKSERGTTYGMTAGGILHIIVK